MMKSNTLKLFVLVGFMAVAFAACLQCRGKPEPRKLITGTVTDLLTGDPIDSAQVVIGDTLTSRRIFLTNSLGNYTAFPDTSGVVQVSCKKDTYHTRLRTVDLSSNRDVYRNVNFELQQH